MGCVSSMQAGGFMLHALGVQHTTVGADNSVMDTRGMEIALEFGIF
jgi:hypothetical protein